MARKTKSEETQEAEISSSTEGLVGYRNNMINTLRPLLLTKREIWKGGSEVRAKHAVEASSFQPIVDEINQVGLQLGEVAVNIDKLRSEG